MFSEEDKRLIAFFSAQPAKEATATEVMESLGYLSVGAVNLHVVRLAKEMASFLHYSPALRSDGQNKWWPCLFDGRDEKHGFVWTLKKEVEDLFESQSSEERFFAKVQIAIQNTHARASRLAEADKKPKVRVSSVFSFERNPDVVAEVLIRAAGICQGCFAPAPFLRKSDSTPYLEVHHKVPLAVGGDDSVENAIALCPNCHRKAHYG